METELPPETLSAARAVRRPADAAFVPSEERLFELWMKRMPMNGMERIESVIGFEQALNKIRAAAWNAGWVARMDNLSTTNPYGDAETGVSRS